MKCYISASGAITRVSRQNPRSSGLMYAVDLDVLIHMTKLASELFSSQLERSDILNFIN